MNLPHLRRFFASLTASPGFQRNSTAASLTHVHVANPYLECCKQVGRTHSTSHRKDLRVAIPDSRTPLSIIVPKSIPDVVYHGTACQERAFVSRTVYSCILCLSIFQLPSTTAISHPRSLRVQVFFKGCWQGMTVGIRWFSVDMAMR